MAEALYITWNEKAATAFDQEYIGGGCYATRAKIETITKRVRWSSENTPELKHRAEQYIRENMQDDRTNLRVIVVTE